MVKLPVAGHPPVRRFVRGHIYYIAYTDPNNPYAVGVYRGLRKGYHSFKTLAGKTSTYCFNVWASAGHAYPVHEVAYEDLPLYMGAPYVSPLYKKLLSGERPRTKRIKSILRLKVNLTRN